MQTQKASIALILLIVVLVIVGGFVFFSKNNSRVPEPMEPQPKTTLTLYIQDTEAARTSDCRVTQKITREVPFTNTPIDASLRILFQVELARYGVYKNVIVSNGIARVYLESDMTPKGEPIGSLSSCEVGHLQSVLRDTLIQYESVESVELYAPQGKIEF